MTVSPSLAWTRLWLSLASPSETYKIRCAPIDQPTGDIFKTCRSHGLLDYKVDTMLPSKTLYYHVPFVRFHFSLPAQHIALTSSEHFQIALKHVVHLKDCILVVSRSHVLMNLIMSYLYFTHEYTVLHPKGSRIPETSWLGHERGRSFSQKL